jgi:hypothetical protein
MKTEALGVDKEEIRDRGLGEALVDAAGPSDSAERTVEAGKSVFEGLTANRRSCVECGYTEAVMHFTFDNITLSIPHQVREDPTSPHMTVLNAHKPGKLLASGMPRRLYQTRDPDGLHVSQMLPYGYAPETRSRSRQTLGVELGNTQHIQEKTCPRRSQVRGEGEGCTRRRPYRRRHQGRSARKSFQQMFNKTGYDRSSKSFSLLSISSAHVPVPHIAATCPGAAYQPIDVLWLRW